MPKNFTELFNRMSPESQQRSKAKAAAMLFTEDDLDLIYDDGDAVLFEDGMRCLELIQKLALYIADRVEPAGYSTVELTAEDIAEVAGQADMDAEVLAGHQKLAAKIGCRMALKFREVA